MLPLDTKNTQNNKNLRLGFIKSLCMQPLAPAYVVFDFQSDQNGLNDPKGNKNIIYTVMKYSETFYSQVSL